MQDSPILRLFKPNSIVIIGDAAEQNSPVTIMIRNITAGSFLGPVMRLNSKPDASGAEVFHSIETLPITPDLAIFCTPFVEIPTYLVDLGRRGVQAAMVPTRLDSTEHDDDRKMRQEIARVAKANGVRLLGPNTLGFFNTSIGLNASLAHRSASPGKVAFISQSDSLFTSILDWAALKGIGFSYCISIGDRLDLNFGHILDFLNADLNTRAVLLYVESVDNVRMFMSAARVLARNKPLLLMKAGRSSEASAAASIHAGKLLRPDEIYDAAFRRAGMLRVFDLETLFATMESLSIARLSKGEHGDRLAILTNGATPAFLAMDSLLLNDGKLAALSQATFDALNRDLPNIWSQGNPLILKSSCSPEDYGKTLRLLLDDPGVDAIVAMRVPVTDSSPEDMARAVVEARGKNSKLVLGSWLGQGEASESDRILAQGGVPCYSMPTDAVNAFLNLVEYRRNQEMLMQVPPSLPEEFVPQLEEARQTVTQALEQGRDVLNDNEFRRLMNAYQIPCVECHVVKSVEEALNVAKIYGYPVTIRIYTPNVYKAKAGGTASDIKNEQQLIGAAGRLKLRFLEDTPDNSFGGYVVQPTCGGKSTHELHVQVIVDPVFGPVMRFGQGGSLAEIFPQRPASLLPLNMNLARELVSRTDIHNLLLGYQGWPAVDMDGLCLFMVKLAQIVIDLPEVVEVSIDPLFAYGKIIMVQGGYVHVAKATCSGSDRLAISPYPKELEEWVMLKNGKKILLRPIRPEDEPDHRELFKYLSVEDRRTRFFGNIAELPHSEMIRYTQIDYAREMAFVARGMDDSGREVTLAVVRAMTNPENAEAEFAVTTRSDMKGMGIGTILMDKIIRYCRSRGIVAIIGSALEGNEGMIALAQKMGFSVHKDFDDDIYEFYMKL